MKVRALNTFYADFFKAHLTEGETVEIKEYKDERQNQLSKRIVKNYIEAGLVEKMPANAKVGREPNKKGVEKLREAKKHSDKIYAERLKGNNNQVGKFLKRK